jgi:hypothetical protein
MIFSISFNASANKQFNKVYGMSPPGLWESLRFCLLDSAVLQYEYSLNNDKKNWLFADCCQIALTV